MIARVKEETLVLVTMTYVETVMMLEMTVETGSVDRVMASSGLGSHCASGCGAEGFRAGAEAYCLSWTEECAFRKAAASSETAIPDALGNS